MLGDYYYCCYNFLECNTKLLWCTADWVYVRVYIQQQPTAPVFPSLTIAVLHSCKICNDQSVSVYLIVSNKKFPDSFLNETFIFTAVIFINIKCDHSYLCDQDIKFMLVVSRHYSDWGSSCQVHLSFSCVKVKLLSVSKDNDQSVFGIVDKYYHPQPVLLTTSPLQARAFSTSVWC